MAWSRWVMTLKVVCVSFVGMSGSQVWAQDVPFSDWQHASPDRVLEFPRDHASHPAFRIEWWYYTGNLDAAAGRRFGYQVTFFRVGVDPAPANPSRWAVRDLYMAHLALTDLENGRHLFDERLNRAGGGWAGARADRLEVWNEDWRLSGDGSTHALELASEDAGFGLTLSLVENRPPVLHGGNGFSQKGMAVGNASHYYSLTRMPTTGEVRIGDETFAVSGSSWMDHEFGTSFLEPSQQGWDWFSLQLDDGTDLMVYQLRQLDGTAHARSAGTVVAADGTTRTLGVKDYRLTPGRVWTSPTSAAAYPVEWRVEVPSASLDLSVHAVVDAQELHTEDSTGVTYWEGSVRVTGTHRGQAVTGRGYLELTGYAGQPLSEVLR